MFEKENRSHFKREKLQAFLFFLFFSFNLLEVHFFFLFQKKEIIPSGVFTGDLKKSRDHALARSKGSAGSWFWRLRPCYGVQTCCKSCHHYSIVLQSIFVRASISYITLNSLWISTRNGYKNIFFAHIKK